jgi:hypothetical protein
VEKRQSQKGKLFSGIVGTFCKFRYERINFNRKRSSKAFFLFLPCLFGPLESDCGYGESNSGIGSPLRRCYVSAFLGDFHNVAHNIPKLSSLVLNWTLDSINQRGMNRIFTLEQIRQAEGYFELGMFSEAWEVLESINATDRINH